MAGSAGPWRLIVLSVIVGLLTGLGAIAFYTLLDASKHLFLGCLAHYHPAGPVGEPPLFGGEGAAGVPVRRWVLLLLPALGGLLSGWIVFRFAPEAEGHGTDAAIDAYHRKGGRVRGIVPLVKAVTAAITIGTGGSGGREGPIAQIGAGIGSSLAGWLRLDTRERQLLMGAGMAGGVGAIFRAPMAGALFAAEILYRDLDFEFELLVPSVIASVVAYAVFSLRFGWEALFATPDFTFHDPRQLLPYTLLAVAVAGGAILYIRSFYATRDAFARLPVPHAWRPALGGLVVGVIGFALPEALGTGYGILQQALVIDTARAAELGAVGLGLLLAVFAGKIATTSFSIGSGGSGGVFGPAVVIGGCLGGAVGLAAQACWPGLGIQPGAFVIVGMAGFFGAAANTPISTIIMVSEMTGNYHLLVPSLWVCILAYLMTRRHTLYEKQVANRFAAPTHTGAMLASVLGRLRVADVLARRRAPPPITVRPATPLAEILARCADTPQDSFPVVDAAGRLLGCVRGRDLRAALGEGGRLDRLLIAEDLMAPPLAVTAAATLFEATQRMAAAGADEVVAVSAETPPTVVGILGHADVVGAYNQEILRGGAPP